MKQQKTTELDFSGDDWLTEQAIITDEMLYNEFNFD